MLFRLVALPKRCLIVLVLVPVTILITSLYLTVMPVNTRSDSYMTSLKDFIREDTSFQYLSVKNLKEIKREKKPNLEVICIPHYQINPFSKDIMSYMKDFGDIDCQYPKFLFVNLLKSRNINVTSYGIQHLYSKPIIYDIEQKYQFSTQQNFIETHSVLKKGYSGALRNTASKHCIIPLSYVKTDDEIYLIFSKNCSSHKAVFTFESNGIIRHNVTSMCIGLERSTDKTLSNNVRLVLTSSCVTTFDIMHKSLIKHSTENDEYCIHPLWGGEPSEGQQLCLYKMCKSEKNLQYSFWTADPNKKVSDLFPLQSEMNMVEVVFSDESKAPFFLLSLQPKDLPLPSSPMKPNIFIFTLDEASAAHLQRKLKLSFKFILEEMKMIDFKYYTPLSEISEQNLFAILTGSINGSEEDLFYVANNLHYATLFSYDDPFYYTSSHAHHSSLPLFHALKQKINVAMHNYCITNIPVFKPSIDYLYSLIDAYPNNPKFASIVFSLITKSNFNALSFIDNAFKVMLKDVAKLKNTIIVINTIKGSFTGKLSELSQGMLERKSPYLGIYFSEDIRDNYKLDQSRRQQLTTPFDLHVTLKSFLFASKYKHPYGVPLSENAAPRTCENAGIQRSMCPCS